jgi:ferric-dicitrate binding protein FerR (iron transport regulator)
MDPLTNPFAVLTFIAAPAILTNASSVMAMGTSNRFARAIDRVRALSAELGSQTAMPEPLKQLRLKQLRFAGRRVLLLVRALAAFYVSLGAFAAASLTSLVGGGLPGPRPP